MSQIDIMVIMILSLVEELNRLKLLLLLSQNVWANLKNDINLLISDGVDQCTMIKNGTVQRRKDFYLRLKSLVVVIELIVS
jgi:hypothetical protein